MDDPQANVLNLPDLSNAEADAVWVIAVGSVARGEDHPGSDICTTGTLYASYRSSDFWRSSAKRPER